MDVLEVWLMHDGRIMRVVTPLQQHIMHGNCHF